MLTDFRDSFLPSLPSMGFLQVGCKFLVSLVLCFVGCNSWIYLQNVYEGLELCKGINTQPFSPHQTAFTSVMTWNFFIMLKRIPLASPLTQLFQTV